MKVVIVLAVVGWFILAIVAIRIIQPSQTNPNWFSVLWNMLAQDFGHLRRTTTPIRLLMWHLAGVIVFRVYVGIVRAIYGWILVEDLLSRLKRPGNGPSGGYRIVQDGSSAIAALPPDTLAER